MCSIISGILASVLPNLLSLWLYQISKAKPPVDFVRYFYISEGLKFAALALLVSAFLLWPGLQVTKFFTAFLLCEFARLFFNAYQLKRTAIK